MEVPIEQSFVADPAVHCVTQRTRSAKGRETAFAMAVNPMVILMIFNAIKCRPPCLHAHEGNHSAESAGSCFRAQHRCPCL